MVLGLVTSGAGPNLPGSTGEMRVGGVAASAMEEAPRVERADSFAMGVVAEAPTPNADPLLGSDVHGFRLERLLSGTPDQRVYLGRSAEGRLADVRVWTETGVDAHAERGRQRMMLERIEGIAGVPQLLGSGVTFDHRPYLATHHVEGPSLLELVSADPASWDVPARRLDLVRQIAKTLNALPHDGWWRPAWRAIRLSDIRLNPDYSGSAWFPGDAIALADASQLYFEADRRAPALEVSQYTAPEVAQNHVHADPRQDVYALGVVALELLLGEALPEDDPLEVLQDRLVRGELLVGYGLADRTELGQLLLSMLSPDPFVRPTLEVVVATLDPRRTHGPWRGLGQDWSIRTPGSYRVGDGRVRVGGSSLSFAETTSRWEGLDLSDAALEVEVEALEVSDSNDQRVTLSVRCAVAAEALDGRAQLRLEDDGSWSGPFEDPQHPGICRQRVTVTFAPDGSIERMKIGLRRRNGGQWGQDEGEVTFVPSRAAR